MTGGAGESVVVKSAIDVGVFGESTRKDGDGVVATVAMAGELDTFGADENVDAGAVERRAEGIGVQGLAPLAVGFVMAVGAVLGVRESAWLDELVAFRGSIAGEGKVVLAEKKVVGFAYLFGVILAFRVFAGLGVSGEWRDRYEQQKANQGTESLDKDTVLSGVHRGQPE